MTLETPQRLAMVSRVGGTEEGKQKLIWIASLLVKRKLVLKMFVLGVVQGRCAGGWDGPRLCRGRSFEGLVSRLELDAE